MTPRWAIKRCLKWLVEWGTALSGAGFIYRRTSTFRAGHRILTYHGISDRPEDSFTVKTEHFKDHMAFLADNYRIVELGDLVTSLCADGSSPGQSVAVTFDDGYAESASGVCEILLQYKIPATFFVVTGLLDEPAQAAGQRFLTWQEVRDLAAAGFSIGSHTVSHRSLGELSPRGIREELAMSLARIAEEIGVAPRGLSYPYGTMRDFSPAIAEAAQQVGYEYAVTAVTGLNSAGCNPFMLRRTALTAGDGLRTFRMITKGNLDPWVAVDKWGSRLQGTRDPALEERPL